MQPRPPFMGGPPPNMSMPPPNMPPPRGPPPMGQMGMGVPLQMGQPPIFMAPHLVQPITPLMPMTQPPVPPAPPAGAQPITQTTNAVKTGFTSSTGVWLFLGGFDEEIPDSIIEKVLGLIGDFNTWKRVTHPVTEKPLGMGFAQFQTQSVVVKAAHILKGIKLLNSSSKPLVAKGDLKISVSLLPSDEISLVSVQNRINDLISDWKKEEEERRKDEKNTSARSADESDHDDVTEEAIEEISRLEPRSGGVSDEIWEDITEFRRMQAKNEILNDQRRKRKLLRIIERLRQEAHDKQLEQQKEQQRERDEAEKAAEKINASEAKPDVIDHSLLKAGTLNMTFAAPNKKTKRNIIRNDDNDEDEKKRRKLVPLQYSEEEQAAVKTTAERLADVAAKISKSAASEPKTDWVKAKKKVEELVVDFIGEAEPSLVNFVLDQLKKSVSTSKLVASLKDVLDEDADDFVKQLQSMISL